MVLSQEDHWSSDLITPLKELFHGLNLKKSLEKNSRISLKLNKRLISLQIKFAVRVKILLINLSFWQFILQPAQIWLWLIYQESHVFLWLDPINQITLSKSLVQWQTDTCLIQELSFFVHFQLTLIWLHLMVSRWLVRLIQKVLEPLV